MSYRVIFAFYVVDDSNVLETGIPFPSTILFRTDPSSLCLYLSPVLALFKVVLFTIQPDCGDTLGLYLRLGDGHLVTGFPHFLVYAIG